MLLKLTPKSVGRAGDLADRRSDTRTIPHRGSWQGLASILVELKAHAPFTVVGALTGVALMVVLVVTGAPRSISEMFFWGLHPLHVLLSALVTAGMYQLHSRGGLWSTVAVGYVGSIGIATLSDSIIPYLGEILLSLPNRGIHLGFIEGGGW